MTKTLAMCPEHKQIQAISIAKNMLNMKCYI